LFRGLVLPVVAQGVDAHDRVADFGHFTGHVAVEVTPAAVTGEEQGHGVLGLASRDFHDRNRQAAVVRTDQLLAQFVIQHLWVVNVVVADAGGGAGGVAHETGAFIVRVVVPRHQPVAVGGGFRQRVFAAFLHQGEADGDGIGLVVVLCGQPAPGEGGARADATDQRRRALELAQGALQCLLLLRAVILGQDHLHDLRLAALAEGNQLAVGQGLVGHHRHGHAGFGGAGRGDAGHHRAIGLGQLLQGRLWGRAVPVPIAATQDHGEQHHKG